MTLSDIDLQKTRVEEICRRHQVAELYAFGSVVTGESMAGSDLDLIVRYATEEVDGAFDRFMGLKDDLESLFQCPVDLLPLKPYRNRIFQASVDKQKALVYAA